MLKSFSKQYFETTAWSTSHYVLGIDEAGRGCLAGPVVVGAVILPLHTSYPLLKDSKIMSAKERDEAYAWITANCWWTTALADHILIDRINIYQATRHSMHEAYWQLYQNFPQAKELLQYVVVDAVPVQPPPEQRHPTLSFHSFNYGETISTSIAAASIVAKVSRDRLMAELDQVYPGYHFARHKGYATPEHIKALQQLGSSPIHRLTFIKNFVATHEQSQQTSLFC